MPEWKDNTGKNHPLHIDGSVAIRLKSVGIDLMVCINDPAGLEPVLQQLSDAAVLMVACARIEGIDRDDEDAYFALWDGDSFETAEIAIMESIANFIRRRPREILHKLIQKAKAAQNMMDDRAIKAVLQVIDNMDFSSALKESTTLGNGGIDCVPLSVLPLSN